MCCFQMKNNLRKKELELKGFKGCYEGKGRLVGVGGLIKTIKLIALR